MGKTFDDPAVQMELPFMPFTVVPGPKRECMIEVDYLDKRAQFLPEQLMAALLVDLREIAEKEQEAPVTDVVISVPVYYTEVERHAMLTAAHVAGFNCLRLLDETTATALAYGIYKTDLPEETTLNVAFVDVGHASTQVCIVALKKGHLAVLGNAWDRNLGGRDFDRVLFDHFAEEFQEKYKVDVRSNPRSSYRLFRACERTKRVLTTNPEAPINVESLTPDVDANGMITRDVFEAKSKPILDRLLAPIQQAMQSANLNPEDIASVEVVGGSTRVPAVLHLLSSYFGKDASRTLNAKETPARGCALQCAMLSPAFKVREFQVQDAFPYGVQFSWEKEGETVTSVVFERGSHVPSAKMLTFYRSKPFELVAEYTPDSDIPSATERHIGKWKIGPFEPSADGKTKLKVKVVLNLNGIVAVDSVHAIEEEVQEAEKEQATASTDAQNPDQPATDAPAAPGGGEGEGEGAAAKKKTKIKKIPVPFSFETGELSKEEIQKLYEVECEMALQARIQEETADARNAVESYVYSLRNRLSDSLSKFVLPEKRDALVSMLDAAEDWLYGDGEDQPKSVYVAKLEELHSHGQPIEKRAQEEEMRPTAIAKLREKGEYYILIAGGKESRFAHLSAEDLAKLSAEAEGALSWLSEKENLQAGQPAYEDPVLLVSDIEKKLDTLVRVCDPILSKPPPKPEKPAAPQNGTEGKEQDMGSTEEGGETTKEPEGTGADADVDMDPDMENQQGEAKMDVDS